MASIYSSCKIKTSGAHPEQYIDKLLGQLGLSLDVGAEARKLLKRAKQEGVDLTGKDPKGIAATVIYLGAKKLIKKVTIDQIEKKTGISHMTIERRLLDFE